MKLTIIFLLVTLTIVGCECNDCGPYTTRTYSLQNSTSENLLVRFYLNSNPEEVILSNDERIELYRISVTSQEGALLNDPFFYDSAHYIVMEQIESVFKQGNCDSENPLCEDYYELESTTKDSGNTYIEYLFVIE